MSKRPPPFAERPSPSNPALEKAILALRMQRFSEAERLALDVLKSNRGNIVAADVLGRALVMQNRADEAIDPLQRAARRPPPPPPPPPPAPPLPPAARPPPPPP